VHHFPYKVIVRPLDEFHNGYMDGLRAITANFPARGKFIHRIFGQVNNTICERIPIKMSDDV
jgi:hypothetical protein